MKKQEIKKKVEAAKSAYMPKAIKEEAEWRARDEVRAALRPDEVAPTEATAPDPAPAHRSVGVTTISARDPRLTGGAQ